MSSIPHEVPVLTPWRRGMILATVTTATAMVAMAVTIANVSLPQIQGALSTTQEQIAWIVTFNIVATAVGTPMTGWLAARFGRRRVMLYGVFGFTVATFLCGIAGGLAELVVYRVIQGFFAAPLVPLAQAIVLDSYPQERHGFATTIYGMGVVMGPIFAPTIGGYLSEFYGWRWVFFMVVPIGILCFGGVFMFIKDRLDLPRTRLDWTGFLALSVTLACFQLMLDRGERNSWFESTEIIAEAALVLGALYVFVVHTATARNPFLSPQILRDRNFVVGLCIALVFGMLSFTPLVLFPTMLQDLQGYPDSIIGWLLGARAIGTLLGFVIMYFGSQLDPRIWLTIGFGVQVLAGLRMSQFHVDVPTFDVAFVSALQGLGTGLLWVPITLVTFATLSPALRAEGMALFHLLRNIGGSIHISLSVAIVVHMARVNYAELSEHVTPYSEMFGYPEVAGQWAIDSTAGVATLASEISRQAAMVGYVNAFLIYGLTGLAVLPLIALVRFRHVKPAAEP